MKNIYSLEQNIKTLEANQLIIVPENIWQNIELELDNHKVKSRSIIWWIFGFLVLFLALGFAYLWNDHAPKSPDTSIHNEINNQEQISQNAIVSNPNEKITKTVTVIEKLETLVEESKNEQITTKAKKAYSNHQELIETNVAKSNKKPTESLTLTNQSQSMTSSQKPILIEDSYSGLTSRANISFEKIGNPSSVQDLHHSSTMEMGMKMNKSCYDFGSDFSLSPYMEMNVVGGFHHQSFTSLGADELTLTRSNTESSWYNFGGNFTLGVNFLTNFYFGVGISRSQLKNKFSLVQEGITRVIIDYDPVTNQPIDTMIVQGTFQSRGEVRHNVVDAHLSLGYMRNLGSFDVGIELGPTFNISHTATGKIMASPEVESRVENLESPIYKNNVGLGIHGAIVLSKPLKNRWSLQLKPSFRQYFNNINLDTYRVDSKWKIFQVQLGIRKDF